MNILLVTAHPETQSFNFALRERAISVLTAKGATLKHTDLYQEPFCPVPGQGDFAAFPANEPLQLMKAQKTNTQYGGYSPDIRLEQAKLLWAEVVLLQFPIWWGTYPAVLKGWIERVLTYGFAYGREKTLPSKAVLLSVTTGGVEDEAEAASYRERVAKMTDDVFGLMRWKNLGAFFAHGPASIEDAEQRRQLLADYEVFLGQAFIQMANP